MPKRRSNEPDEERWRRKMKKYEAKLRKHKRIILYSSDDENLQDDPLPIPSELDIISAVEVSHEEPINEEPIHEEPVHLETAQEVPAEVFIDPELLEALGDLVPETCEWGENINENISKRWEPILKSGLSKEIKEEILKKYLLPKNCPLTKPPILNAEIAAALTESARNRDQRICKKQIQLGCVLSILGRLASGMLTKSLATPDALRLISDATKLLADSHFVETETRRALVIPLLDKSIIDPFKDRKRDSHLFGENLGEFIKSSRGIKKTGELIQAPAASNLNWKGPPPRQPQRASNARRGGSSGGPRAPQTTAASSRRRAQPPAPPAAARRAAPASRSAPASRRDTTSRTRR